MSEANNQTKLMKDKVENFVTPVKNDEQYYDDFFRYAWHYGDKVARIRYCLWSPPLGTTNPYGINPNVLSLNIASSDNEEEKEKKKKEVVTDEDDKGENTCDKRMAMGQLTQPSQLSQTEELYHDHPDIIHAPVRVDVNNKSADCIEECNLEKESAKGGYKDKINWENVDFKIVDQIAENGGNQIAENGGNQILHLENTSCTIQKADRMICMKPRKLTFLDVSDSKRPAITNFQEATVNTNGGIEERRFVLVKKDGSEKRIANEICSTPPKRTCLNSAVEEYKNESVTVAGAGKKIVTSKALLNVLGHVETQDKGTLHCHCVSWMNR